MNNRGNTTSRFFSKRKNVLKSLRMEAKKICRAVWSRPSVQLAIFIVLLVTAVSLGFRSYYLEKVSESLQNEAVRGEQFSTVKITKLADALQKEIEKSSSLNKNLSAEQSKNSLFESQLQAITSTVGTLQKLSQTDKELLQKYSKVYFLNEHYIPTELASIDPRYAVQSEKNFEILRKVEPFLSRLLKSSESAGLALKIVSSYRSFGTQSALKANYRLVYGAGTANQFSADQGYSEHQLGTTIDFTSPKAAGSFSGFEKTPEYTWLLENAFRYGFILSYPKENRYYEFEPWHWRFVGIGLATKLHNEKRNFYDLDQREIDAFLVDIFNDY